MLAAARRLGGAGAMVLAVAWPACVQAQAPAVAVYGNLDVALGSFKRGLPGEGLRQRLLKVESGIVSGSFFGLKGEEHLGGEAHVFFKLESTVRTDTGATTQEFWGRTSELGLRGRAGTLSAGHSLSLSFRAYLDHSPFRVFTPLGLYGAMPFAAFQRDSLTYISPRWSGTRLALQHQPAEGERASSVRAWQVEQVLGRLTLGMTHTQDDHQRLWQWGGAPAGP